MKTDLPEAQYPMVTRVTTDRLFPPEANSAVSKDEPIIWQLGEAHPLLAEMIIVRMFAVDHGVEVYSRPIDEKKKGGMRNTVPMRLVRLVEEVMPQDVFVRELSIAEAGDDGDDDDDGGDEDEGFPRDQPHAVSNGQPTT